MSAGVHAVTVASASAASIAGCFSVAGGTGHVPLSRGAGIRTPVQAAVYRLAAPAERRYSIGRTRSVP
jgi:hypothetical protein